MPEWSGQQQILLLCQSVAFGGCLGFVFDLFNLPSKSSRRCRVMTFVCDVVFFAVAAIATFYYSLAVMDGRMHPLLFFGTAIGMVVQHLLIGRYFSRVLYLFGRCFCRLIQRAGKCITIPLRVVYFAIFAFIAAAWTKIRKNVRKVRKKSRFFEKNS